MILKLIKKLAVCLFLINLTSCFQNKKIEIKSDYCYLYEPLNDNIEKSIIEYWESKKEIIENKNKFGGLKTPEEKLLEIFINYIGANDKRYYDKKCHIN